MVVLRTVLKLSNLLHNHSRNMSLGRRPVQEVRIPLSAGYVAGKWWGPEDKRPILTYHGWQDNSGSFDLLIPQLPEDIPILAIDFPGHGFSYRLPPGMAYHNKDSVVITKMIKNFFQWDKVTLMGHSLGAIVLYIYGSIFPNEIDFMVCIDGPWWTLVNPKKMDESPRVALSIEEQIKYNELFCSKEEPPSYTIKEMEQKMHEASRKSIDVSTAKHILYRNIAPSQKHPGKFYFNRDPRIKVGPLHVNDLNELISCAPKVTYPLHVTKFTNSPFFGNQTIFESLNDVLREHNQFYEFIEVPGVHHDHLNNPECVSTLITSFIRKYDTQERSKGGLPPEIKVDESMYQMYKYKKKVLGE